MADPTTDPTPYPRARRGGRRRNAGMEPGKEGEHGAQEEGSTQRHEGDPEMGIGAGQVTSSRVRTAGVVWLCS